jgi:hypothetical protein
MNLQSNFIIMITQTKYEINYKIKNLFLKISKIIKKLIHTIFKSYIVILVIIIASECLPLSWYNFKRERLMVQYSCLIRKLSRCSTKIVINYYLLNSLKVFFLKQMMSLSNPRLKKLIYLFCLKLYLKVFKLKVISREMTRSLNNIS